MNGFLQGLALGLLLAVVASDDSLDLLRRSFGSEILDVHDVSTLLNAPLTQTSTFPRYFGCGHVGNLRNVEQFQPIFAENDTICYIAPSNVSPTEHGFVTWVQLPSQLKIDPAVITYIKNNLLKSVDWTSLMLEVSIPPSKHFDVLNSTDVDAIHDSLHRALEHESLSSLAALAESTVNNVWKLVQPFFTFQNAETLFETCHFDDVSTPTHMGVSSIVFSDLTSIPSSPCLALLVATLSSLDIVDYIQLTPHFVPLNDVTSKYVQTGSTSSSPYTDSGLDGEGHIIGVADTGADDRSCYLNNADGSQVTRSSYTSPTTDSSKRKIIQYVAYVDGADTTAGHGTHVCGTITGKSTGSQTYNGVAPEAKIAFYDIGNSGPYLSVPSLETYVFPAAKSAGAWIHSDSWGGGSNAYNSFALEVDRYTYNNNNYVALFAAGNAGPGSQTIIAPAIAKNSLTVGAAGTGHGSGRDTLASFSSRGPTFDSRFGIDIIVQGHSTYSARADPYSTSCSITSMSGTSMATPGAAGATALVRQYFMDASFWANYCNSLYPTCGAFTPSGSMLKTTILHSGENMGYTYPGPEQGFGRLQLNNVLPLSGVTPAGFDLFVQDVTLNILATKTYSVSVTSSASPFKATISWMDPPNSVYASKQLLNNIDLTVLTPSGSMYYGNGNSAGDSVNNAEMVYIASPQTGTYTVTVKPRLYGSGTNQKVSVVMTSVGSVTAIDGVMLQPTESPSLTPTLSPTAFPTVHPTRLPTFAPSNAGDTISPTESPTLAPTPSPTVFTTVAVTARPTVYTTSSPTTEAAGLGSDENTIYGVKPVFVYIILAIVLCIVLLLVGYCTFIVCLKCCADDEPKMAPGNIQMSFTDIRQANGPPQTVAHRVEII